MSNQPPHQGRSSASYYKGSYEGSSKRYHSPAGVSSSLSSMHSFYDEGRKRPRTDNYGSQSANNGNSQTYNKEYSSGGGGGRGGSYKSYYEGGSGRSGAGPPPKDLPYSRREDFGRGKYNGEESRPSAPSARLPTKSIVRRIPPPLTPPASKASLGSKKSSAEYRPIPLMHNMSGSSSAGTSKEFYGSRMRQAPPEYHGHQSSSKFSAPSSNYSSTYQSSTYRKPGGFITRSRLPGSATSKFSKPYTSSSHANYSSSASISSSGLSGNLAALRRATQKAAESVTSRIRKRAAAGYAVPDEKRRFIRRRPIQHDNTEKEKPIIKKERVDYDKEEKTGEHVVEELLEDEEAKTRRVALSEKNPENEDAKDTEMESDDVLIKNINKEKVDANEETDKTEGDPSVKLDERRKRDHKTSSRDSREGKSRTRETKDEDDEYNKTLLKLHCHYCDVRCISYREFSLHLRSFGHNKFMNAAVSEMRKKLSKLRTEQRDEQRKLEKSAKTLLDTTSYCRVCELNFRTDPAEHEANEVHNQIKTLIYQKCEVCDIEFRIWKVYLYHLAALEHAKRVALKELRESEDKGEHVKGTNLSQEELGMDLVEQRVVFFCNACNRFIPIKGDEGEVKNRHCMTLAHIKNVEEFRERERKYAARKKEEEERKEREKKAQEAKGENSEADANSGENKGESNADESGEGKQNECLDEKKLKGEEEEQEGDEQAEGREDDEEKDEDGCEEQNEEEGDEEAVSEIEEQDEDEIELHAGEDDDVAEDEEMEEATWSRRTRSSGRKPGKRV